MIKLSESTKKALLDAFSKVKPKKRPSYTDYLTKGLILGEEVAAAKGRKYIINLCERLIAMDEILAMKQLCQNTIDVNTLAEDSVPRSQNSPK